MLAGEDDFSLYHLFAITAKRGFKAEFAECLQDGNFLTHMCNSSTSALTTPQPCITTDPLRSFLLL